MTLPDIKPVLHKSVSSHGLQPSSGSIEGAASDNAAPSAGSQHVTVSEAHDIAESDGRLWIGENGQIVCSKHGGNYLKENIASAPKSPHHSTPLGTWVDVTNNPDVKGVPCEICESS